MKSNAGRVRLVMRAALALGAAALGFGVVAASGGSVAASSAPPPAKFSHGVAVDEQRAGFEPDSAPDPAHSNVIYTSVPNGFSTTAGFIWSSNDHGRSYNLIPGNVPQAGLASGKPATCAGGGDTDLRTDSAGGLYFADLQGLTNVSSSASQDGGSTWASTCATYLNAPVDRMWDGVRGSLAGGNLQLYQDVDAVNQPNGNNLIGNQLVDVYSNDGVVFQPVFNPNFAADCGTATTLTDCVTSDEGISGNQIVDPGAVYIVHTSATQGAVIMEKGDVSASPTTATWTHETVYDGGSYADGNPKQLTGYLFSVTAQDRAGNLYAVWAQGPQCDPQTDLLGNAIPGPNNCNQGQIDLSSHLTAPTAVYYAFQRSGSDTWSQPSRVSLPGGTSVMPWITAGDNGRIDIVYLHTSETSESVTDSNNGTNYTMYGSDFLSHANWDVYMAQSLTAASAPSFTTSKATEYPNKYGTVCTNGLLCGGTDDRS